jgi:hypothetical protein
MTEECVIPFSFFVIPAKAGIQFFISGVNYKGNLLIFMPTTNYCDTVSAWAQTG